MDEMRRTQHPAVVIVLLVAVYALAVLPALNRLAQRRVDQVCAECQFDREAI